MKKTITILTVILIVTLKANAQFTLQDSLVGWYPFTGNANDSSGNLNNGVVNGATLTTDRFGNLNSAYFFNGANNYIELTNNSLFFNGPFTINTWVTIDNLTPSFPDAPIISQYQSNGTGQRKFIFGYRSWVGQKGISFYDVNNSNLITAYYPINWNPIQSNWYNVSVVYTPGISVKTYVNGQMHYIDTTNVPVNLISSTSPIRIGHLFSSGWGNGYWNGKIDDIRVYNRALSSCEVQQLFTGGLVQSIITPLSSTTFCNGDSVILTANTDSLYNYQWLYNGTVLVGATDTTYTTNQNGNYQVVITDGFCTDTSTNEVVTVNPLPTPVITQAGNDITTGIYNSYQWLLNGTPIGGETNQIYTPISNGNYQVIVSDSNGCSDTSAVFVMNSVGVNEINNTSISIYPNPTTGIVNIGGLDNNDQIYVYNVMGELIFTSKARAAIDLSNISNGIYLIRILNQNNEFIKTEKIIIE